MIILGLAESFKTMNRPKTNVYLGITLRLGLVLRMGEESRRIFRFGTYT